MADDRPQFLVTNDDGVDSPGLEALAEAARCYGDVTIVAPRWEMSATSHAITLHTPLRIIPQGDARFALHEGTPVDCVYVAVNHICSRRPTLVLSGINLGLNIGHDVIYSGTVAAARQAFLMGVTGIAFSYASGGGEPVHAAIPWVKRVIGAALERREHGIELLNVNIPNPGIAAIEGFSSTVLGHRIFASDIERRSDPRGREYLWIGGSRIDERDVPNSDCEAIRRSRISVTPLAIDTTAHDRLDVLRSWKLWDQ